jgi:transposase-like protein
MTTSKDKPAATAIKDLLSHNPDGLREIVRAVMQEMLEAETTDAQVLPVALIQRSRYRRRTIVDDEGYP